MITAFLNIHLLVVILFLLLFLYKAVLLFLNQQERLAKVRTYTKMLDIVFGVLTLVTGGFLAFSYSGPWPTWLMVKIVLVFAAIPLAIVGLKKHSKALTAVSLLIFGYVYGVAETKSIKMRPATIDEVGMGPEPVRADGKQEPAPNPIMSLLEGTQFQNTNAIYRQLCAPCHGEDGQKGVGGATNLLQSKLSAKARQEVIANGRGLMPGYRTQLTEQEMEALALFFNE